MQEREFLQEKKSPGSLDFRRIANILWRIKYWLLLSVALCLAVAWLHIRYSVPQYQKSIAVVINSQQSKYTDNYQLVANTLGGGPNTLQMDNQLFLLKSTRLMLEVVRKLDLHVRYYSIGRFIEAEQYANTPVWFDFIPAEGREKSYINMIVSFTPEKKVDIESFLVNGMPVKLDSHLVAVDQVVDFDAGSFCFSSPEHVDIGRLTGKFRITRSSEERAAGVISGRLNVVANSRQPNMLTISLTDRHPKRAEDILNTLMEEYNIMSKYYDSQGIRNTIDFLDERIQILESELDQVEGRYASYRASTATDIGSHSQTAKGYSDRLNDVALQIRLLDIIKEAIHDDNVHELIPANIGINDGALNSSIDQYNRQVIERDRMLSGSSVNNPMVQGATTVLGTLKNNLQQSVRNLESAYNLQQQSLSTQLGSSQRQLAAMPSRQLAQTRVSRLQQVKEPLYILLQQKREEAMLTLSSLSDHVYVVDQASGSNTPISPNARQIYMLAIILALGVPTAFILLINLFRSRVLFEKDIIDRTDIPILGIVPRGTKDKGSPMKSGTVTETGRDPLTESFRMLRSKFQYLNIDQKEKGAFVLQVTSSGPQEGKSFMSVNMALSLSCLGKKVLLIGADLRKPTLARYLGMDRRAAGLSDFLARKEKDIHAIITPYGDSEFMDVITAGPTPFNPSELLSSPSFREVIDTLRPSYDYIIIDSAPFLMVADSFMISQHVDSVLYVVRSGFTKLSILDTLQHMYCEGSFKSIMIVLNSVNFRKNAFFGGAKPGYGYGYGYSYGYGYGAGYGGDDDEKPKKRGSRKAR